ncbi:MAG: hypothetical protein RIK87_14975 [Fuerstiella sp.]
MKRIFLTLTVLATVLMLVAVVLGLSIGNSSSLNPEVQSQISTHMLIGMGVLTFAILVHAISLTYFMGTGRWIEETSHAYSLSPSFHALNQKIKYRTLPGMTFCILLLIATGALGAAADPATPISLDGIPGVTGADIHFFTAMSTVIINLLTNFTQFVAISKNTDIVNDVLAEVKRIREERGLPV